MATTDTGNPSGVSASSRIWTSVDGHTVQADLVELVAGGVRLKRDNGPFLFVPLEQFSPDDRRHVIGKYVEKAEAAIAQGRTPQEPVREWTSSTGTTTRARMVEMGRESVQLELASGMVLTVPFTQLSQADREYVEVGRILGLGVVPPSGIDPSEVYLDKVYGFRAEPASGTATHQVAEAKLQPQAARPISAPRAWSIVKTERTNMVMAGGSVTISSGDIYLYVHLHFPQPPGAAVLHSFRVTNLRGQGIGQVYGIRDSTDALVIFQGDWENTQGLRLEGLGASAHLGL